MAGLVLVAVFVVVAGIGPWIVLYPEDARGAVHLERKLQPPSAAHDIATTMIYTHVFNRSPASVRSPADFAGYR